MKFDLFTSTRYGCAAIFISLLLTGCSLMAIKEQSEIVESLGSVSGTINVPATLGTTVYATLIEPQGQHFKIVKQSLLSANRHYKFSVLAGTYHVAAFVDSNGDGAYQPGEPATYSGIENSQPTKFTIQPNETLKIAPLTIKGAIASRGSSSKLHKSTSRAYANIGKVTSLQDPMFSRENALMGFWRPVDYTNEFGGGLMMLQPFEKEKTPVIFVHGIMGSSLDFKELIASVDRSRFQPWVLNYASGVRLELISDYFDQALLQIQKQHPVDKVIIIAHSMGGLMTRSFVMKHQASVYSVKLAMVMTINSPLYGMDSAAKGVKSSPIVIPSWRDVARNSEFVQTVHSWQWPKEIPYQMVFSYLPGEDGDGVVPLNSQLSQSLQNEATHVQGFEAQHAGILSQADFISYFNTLLKQY
ncbi:esterase/lipase family protein [Marinagarivorans cellulosilyticus]|uniref:AB hydrolase-1 domain-containing protein n=1 Tax=Marinagarivorans cellulosilyticus TaxID=2721545 RepID=A0AAN1WF80_9GAMM|nr:alpha/beta fold hydrolase [Marinagarivorans cellulosilyticus]BCD96504.1 hypothetical protein MARGE09_P0704 [Marinagarivorans cellulosilyticus]